MGSHEPLAMAASEMILIAVVGAHLSGQPLNGQLTEREARLVRSCRTAPEYRLYALKETVPVKPGLERVAKGTGHAIEVEVWEMPEKNLGSFVKQIPPPLGIGTLTLEDGTTVKGFICEPYALAEALDISHFGGWRGYLKSR
jgi:allophanate hydrolase